MPTGLRSDRSLRFFQPTRLAAFAVLLALLIAGQALAQTSMGAVSGIVTDTSAAVVPGATVTLTNQDTNVHATRVTNEHGY